MIGIFFSDPTIVMRTLKLQMIRRVFDPGIAPGSKNPPNENTNLKPHGMEQQFDVPNFLITERGTKRLPPVSIVLGIHAMMN